MLDRLLDLTGSGAILPIALLVAAGWAIPGFFAFSRSRSQNRRDFLELWRDNPTPDDLWLEAMVRHVFGEWLPASLIRSLLKSPQAGRALLEVGSAWQWLEFNDESLEISWKARRYSSSRNRTLLIALKYLGYGVLMVIALSLAYLLLNSNLTGVKHGLWVFPLMLGGFAIQLSLEASSLFEAGRAVPRWLGLP